MVDMLFIPEPQKVAPTLTDTEEGNYKAETWNNCRFSRVAQFKSSAIKDL